ncbi:ABC transporter substrate-binding protein [Sneathiella chungangensis]|uniref:ABC transporter substrate-binding protein n=1 Tax=Sneathiella chungangensis TaxID=1418234 RepID=A0A845MJH3_9PROT|nr:penicillin-binding protein activator [Sneathiella chungangensis]MZR24213.1 ABC transporter substrate-binding protein [Sneathiella chungangensis]
MALLYQFNWKSVGSLCLAGILLLLISACQPAKVSESEQKDIKEDTTNAKGAQDLKDLLPPKRTPSYEDLTNTPTVDPLARLIEPGPAVTGLRATAPAGLTEPIKIAILLPLSGPAAAVGNDLLKAANIALFDLANGQVQLLPFDTQGTPRGAESAAAEALVSGAELILGPLFSSSVATVRPLAQSRGVNVITFSTDTTVAGDGVYVMGLTVGQQIRRVMEFAYRQGLFNFAVLAPNTPYGDAVVRNVTETTGNLGLFLDRTVRYPVNVAPGSQDLHEIAKTLGDYDLRHKQLLKEIQLYKSKEDDQSKDYVKRLEKLDTFGEVTFDALVIPEGGARLKELASLLSYYDVDPEIVQFIGTGLWEDPSLSAEPALVGGWFSAPAPAKAAEFRKRFESLYGYQPSRIASLAYDAMALAGIMALDPVDARFKREDIENPSGFTGYDGIFRFPENGVAERGLAVLEVGPKGQLVLEPAPDSFAPALN